MPFDPSRPLSNVEADAQRGMVSPELIPGDDYRQILRAQSRTSIGEMIACTFSIDPSSKRERNCPVPAPYTSLLRGLIEWGNGGVSHTAELDIGQGVQVAVPAETVIMSAKAIDITPPWEKPMCLPCAPLFKVVASLAYGCVGRLAQLTEVVHLREPDTEGPQIGVQKCCRLTVPNFANRVTMQLVGKVGDHPRAALRLQQYGTGYPMDFIYEGGAGPDEFGVGQQIVLNGGVAFVDVINLNSTTPLIAFVVFGLSL